MNIKIYISSRYLYNIYLYIYLYINMCTGRNDSRMFVCKFIERARPIKMWRLVPQVYLGILSVCNQYTNYLNVQYCIAIILFIV